KLPSRAAKSPSRAAKLPTRAAKAPSRAAKLPTRAVELPSRAVKAPSRAAKVPTRAVGHFTHRKRSNSGDKSNHSFKLIACLAKVSACLFSLLGIHLIKK